MAKEYKTLIFNDNQTGRKEMSEAIDLYSKYGWELKSKEATQQGWSFGKTCCLGCIFVPLALLGKKDNVIHIILEREDSPKNKALDAEMTKEAEAENIQTETPASTSPVPFVLLGIGILVIIIFGLAALGGSSTSTSNAKQQKSNVSVAQAVDRIPYLLLTTGTLNYIILDPKYVNTTDLTALGKQLHDDYADTGFIRISIYDDKRAVAVRDSVINETATQYDTNLYDAHYVAQYSKNDNTGYNEFSMYHNGSVSKKIDY